MHVLVVVLTQLLLLFGTPAAQGLLEVSLGIFGADHEADLSGWIGWIGGVGIVNSREDFLAVLLQLGDEWEVEPLVLSCRHRVSMTLTRRLKDRGKLDVRTGAHNLG